MASSETNTVLAGGSDPGAVAIPDQPQEPLGHAIAQHDPDLPLAGLLIALVILIYISSPVQDFLGVVLFST